MNRKQILASIREERAKAPKRSSEEAYASLERQHNHLVALTCTEDTQIRKIAARHGIKVNACPHKTDLVNAVEQMSSLIPPLDRDTQA